MLSPILGGRTDAYIYIGAQEVKGGRSKILGITEHIDDAKIQQFVNSKTNRPVEFSYIPLEIEGHQIALIHISTTQQRPIYLTRDYGGLKKDTVYLRRGSSTGVASLDEIALMGAATAEATERIAKLSAFLVIGKHQEIIEKALIVTVTNAEIPHESEFPSYGDCSQDLGFGIHVPDLSFNNHAYYSEYAKWCQTTLRYKRFHLCVKNTGNSVARDVKLVLTAKRIAPHVHLCMADDLPEKPSRSRLPVPRGTIHSLVNKPDVTCNATADGWRVVSTFSNILAMDNAISDDMLYVGAQQTVDIPISAEIFADNLPRPIHEEFSIHLDVSQKRFSVVDFVRSSSNVS